MYSYHQICFRGQNTDGSSIHPACCSRHRRPTPVPILHLELPVTFQKKDLYLHNNCTTILFAKIDQLKNGNTFGCFDPCIISIGLFIRLLLSRLSQFHGDTAHVQKTNKHLGQTLPTTLSHRKGRGQMYVVLEREEKERERPGIQ